MKSTVHSALADFISLVMQGGMAKKDVLLGGSGQKGQTRTRGGGRGPKRQDLGGTSFLDDP